MPLHGLSEISAVLYREKGVGSHAEVVCRTKGIPLLVWKPEHKFKQGKHIDLALPSRANESAREAFASADYQLQISIYDTSDLDKLDFTRVDRIFIRHEFLMMKHAADGQRPDLDLRLWEYLLRTEIEELVAALPKHVRVVFRGLDVRSDDQLLGRWFFGSNESNPELGQHGLRQLMKSPKVVGVEASVVNEFDVVDYAVPFVTSLKSYDSFRTRYGSHFQDSVVIPFVESPEFLFSARNYRDAYICLGLKDLSQFYWACDRGAVTSVGELDYLDPVLLSAIRSSVLASNARGASISIYQNLETLAMYTAGLRGCTWSPSMTAPDYRSLNP